MQVLLPAKHNKSSKKKNPDCESVFWDTSAVAGGGDAMCTQLKGMLDILRGLIKRGLKILNT